MKETSNIQIAPEFWRKKSLAEMNAAEWEALCDGCGKCCIVLAEADDGEIWETDLACELFDQCDRRCTDYAHRKVKVPGCVTLTPENIQTLKWMPDSCAYRLLATGLPLPEWHPLLTGNPASTALSGNAVELPLVSELDVEEDETEDHITVLRFSPQK